MTSAAAIEGLRANGLRWNRRFRIGLGPSLLGKYNDAAETDSPATDEQVEEAALKIVAAVRAFAKGVDEPERGDLERRADELEMVADCGLDEVNFAMGELYDSFDYWRILVETPRMPR